MAQKHKRRRPHVVAWQVESLRFTAFPARPEDALEAVRWSDLIGEPPRKEEARPREGRRAETGTWEEGYLSLEVTHGRVDWRYALELSPERPFTGFPILGPYDEVENRFLALMQKWLRTSPKLSRAAWGAVLLFPVENRVEGYKSLGAFLSRSVKVDPKGSSDLLYRINRRCPSSSGVANLEVNRLATWSVLSVQHSSVRFSGGVVDAAILDEPAIACRLELDINTAPEFGKAFSKSAVRKLLSELAGLAREITVEGDVP